MPFGLKNAPAIFSGVVVAAFKYFIQKFLQVYMDDWTVYGLIRDHLEKPATDAGKVLTTSDRAELEEVYFLSTIWDTVGTHCV